MSDSSAGCLGIAVAIVFGAVLITCSTIVMFDGVGYAVAAIYIIAIIVGFCRVDSSKINNIFLIVTLVGIVVEIVINWANGPTFAAYAFAVIAVITSIMIFVVAVKDCIDGKKEDKAVIKRQQVAENMIRVQTEMNRKAAEGEIVETEAEVVEEPVKSPEQTERKRTHLGVGGFSNRL